MPHTRLLICLVIRSSNQCWLALTAHVNLCKISILAHLLWSKVNVFAKRFGNTSGTLLMSRRYGLGCYTSAKTRRKLSYTHIVWCVKLEKKVASIRHTIWILPVHKNSGIYISYGISQLKPVLRACNI